MYKMTVTYDDFNGDSHTRDVYFNLSKMEMLEMYSSQPGENGLVTYLQKIVNAKDNAKILEAFIWFVDKAYGERSEDGTRFIKVAEDGHRLVEDFKSTGAYDEVLWQLASSANAASDFVSAIVPKEYLQQAVASIELSK